MEIANNKTKKAPIPPDSYRERTRAFISSKRHSTNYYFYKKSNQLEKTICAEFITDTAFRYYFTGMDRSVYYINGQLILARGEDPENTMILSKDNDLNFEAFQVVAKKMFISLLYELQGN